jgi:hypothetical protein
MEKLGQVNVVEVFQLVFAPPAIESATLRLNLPRLHVRIGGGAKIDRRKPHVRYKGAPDGQQPFDD